MLQLKKEEVNQLDNSTSSKLNLRHTFHQLIVDKENHKVLSLDMI